MSQTNSIHANNYILKDSDSETVFQYNIVSITGVMPESNGVITIGSRYIIGWIVLFHILSKGVVFQLLSSERIRLKAIINI